MGAMPSAPVGIHFCQESYFWTWRLQNDKLDQVFMEKEK